jgi:hypothetical protein
LRLCSYIRKYPNFSVTYWWGNSIARRKMVIRRVNFFDKNGKTS